MIEIKEKICAFLQDRHPDCAFALFHGSMMRGDFHSESDVDLIIVYSTPRIAYSELSMVGKTLFDINVYDLESINGAMHLGIDNGNFGLTRAVLNSSILPTVVPQATALQEAAKRIIGAGPILPDRKLVRKDLTTMLDDLDHCSNQIELSFLATEIFSTVTKWTLREIGFGGIRNRYAASTLLAEEKRLVTDLSEGLQLALSGDSTHLSAVCWEWLNSIGGALRAGYKAPIPHLIRLPMSMV